MIKAKSQLKCILDEIKSLANDVTTLKESTKWLKLAVIGIFAGVFTVMGVAAQVGYALLTR